MKHLLFLLSTISLVSCGPKLQLDSENKNLQGIVGGQDVVQGSILGASIVSVYDIKEEAICTGSLIADNIVLTAAHCVSDNIQDLRIVFGVDVDQALAIREVDVRDEVVRPVIGKQVHPGFAIARRENRQTDYNDIAVIKFKGTLPQGFKPALMLKDISLLKRGVLVTVAGYGVSKVDMKTIDPRKVHNLEEAIESGEIFCDDKRRRCLEIEMSGDGLLRVTKAPIAFVLETEVRLDESKGHGTCNGDSGGPAYLEMDGQNYLFGITSRGSGTCDSTGVYTNALVFKEWVAESIKKMN